MMTDTVLIEALRAETLSPLAAELLERFAGDVAARDADMAELLSVARQPQPVSIETSPRPIA